MVSAGRTAASMSVMPVATPALLRCLEPQAPTWHKSLTVVLHAVYMKVGFPLLTLIFRVLHVLHPLEGFPQYTILLLYRQDEHSMQIY